MAEMMCKSAFSLFYAFIVLQLLHKSGLLCKIISKPVTVDAHNCNLLILGGYLTCNCSHRNFVEVPQDLNPAIQILFLMYSSFTRLDENSFMKYPKLLIVHLQFTTYADTIDPINYYTFRPLENLEALDMANIETPVNFSFYWPSNLKILWANNNPFITELDLSSLKQLEALYAQSCGLQSFPKLNILTPLKVLDLRLNPLENLSVEDIAPFCLLKAISLEWHQLSHLSTPERFCQCLRLGKWIQMYEIHYKFGTSGTSFICVPPADAKINDCNLEYSEELLQQRVECLERNSQPLFSGWFLVVVAIIALTPFVILACWYSERRQKALLRKQRKGARETVAEEHDDFQ